MDEPSVVLTLPSLDKRFKPTIAEVGLVATGEDRRYDFVYLRVFKETRRFTHSLYWFGRNDLTWLAEWIRGCHAEEYLTEGGYKTMNPGATFTQSFKGETGKFTGYFTVQQSSYRDRAKISVALLEGDPDSDGFNWHTAKPITECVTGPMSFMQAFEVVMAVHNVGQRIVLADDEIRESKGKEVIDEAAAA